MQTNKECEHAEKKSIRLHFASKRNVSDQNRK